MIVRDLILLKIDLNDNSTSTLFYFQITGYSSLFWLLGIYFYRIPLLPLQLFSFFEIIKFYCFTFPTGILKVNNLSLYERVVFFLFSKRMRVCSFAKRAVNDEHVSTCSRTSNFHQSARVAIISSSSMEGKWHTAETFQPLRGRSHLPNFCIMLTEKRLHVCVCTRGPVARSRAYKFPRERTCVRDAEGPESLERTFEVVAETRLCATERGRDNGNRDMCHFPLARCSRGTAKPFYLSNLGTAIVRFA